MTRGFVDTGRFEPIFAVEIDEHAAATYEANFGDHVHRRRTEASPIEDGRRPSRSADVVIGGPPCQGFSPLNRNGVGLERRGALARVPARTRAESRPDAFVMENVPELLRSDEYADVQEGAPSTSSGSASRADPQRRRLRRPATAAAGDRDRGPRRRRPVARRDARRPRRAPARAASPGGRSATPSAGCRCKPTGKDWHNGRNPRPRRSSATSTCRTTAATASRCRTASTREGLGASRPALLAEQADRHHRCLRPPLLGSSRVHDPHRVLQAGEGPLPAPHRGPADHDPRGRAMHELPGRLRLPARPEVDGGREADRQRRSAALAQAIAEASRHTSTHGRTAQDSGRLNDARRRDVTVRSTPMPDRPGSRPPPRRVPRQHLPRHPRAAP